MLTENTIKIWIEDGYIRIGNFGSRNVERMLPLKNVSYLRLRTMPGSAELLFARKSALTSAGDATDEWNVTIEATCPQFGLVIVPDVQRPVCYIIPDAEMQPDVLHISTNAGDYTINNVAAMGSLSFFESLFMGMQEANANETPGAHYQKPRNPPPAVIPTTVFYRYFSNKPK